MAARKTLTARAFERVAARLGPCELERGRVTKLEFAGMQEAGATANAMMQLARCPGIRRGGRTLINLGVVTQRRPDTVRGIDVAYFSFERVPRNKRPDGFTDVPPNLAVEIVGKGQGWNKMLEKAGEYLRMGVDLVWIIDPKKRRVCVLRNEQEPEMLNETGVLADPRVLPKFRCRVADLFR